MIPSLRTTCVMSLGAGLLCGATLLGWTADTVSHSDAAAPGRHQAGRGGPPKPAADAPAPAQILEGTDENDTLTGGDGTDWILGKKGIDILRGGRGSDRIDGGEGDDNIDGGPDADIIDAGAGSDTARGGDGNDTIDGGDDDDLLDGGDGIDDIDGGDGIDTLRGGGANDVLSGGDENDTINGDAGDDRVSGNDGSDTLSGGAGNDVLKGGEGNDSLSGDAGDDRLDGDDDDDFLLGGQGNDLLLGSIGADTLHGQAGHDALLGGDGTDMLDGGLGLDWVFGGTGADLMLGGDGEDIFVIRAGDVPAGEVETINGGGGTDVLFLTGFEGAISLKGETRLVDPVTGGVYLIVNVERAEYTVVLSAVQVGAAGPISLRLVNPSSTAASGRVIFYGPDGAIVPASRAKGEAAADDLLFSVPALGSLRLEAFVNAPAIPQVFAASPLAAAIAGGSAAALVDAAMVPVVEDPVSGIGTGVLIANTVADTSLNLSLYAMDGRELDADLFMGAKEVQVPAYGHAMFFLRDLFPNLKNFRGSLMLDADTSRPQAGGPVSVVALERSSTGAIAMSPAIPLRPSRPRGPVYLPHVTAGGDTESTIVVMNPSRGPARGTLRFFDESGKPWPIAVNKQRAADAVPFDVGGEGSAAFTIAAGGAPQRGSAHVDAGQGVIAALVRARDKTGIAHLPAGAAVSSFIAPATRDASAGVSTRVSINSTGSAATLRLRLRTADGAEVTGGAAEVHVPANGTMTRTIEQLFPSAATNTFDGTLTVQTDGTVAATVVQTGAAQTIVLPIIKMN